MKKRKLNIFNIVRLIIIIILLVIICISSYKIYLWHQGNKKTAEVNKHIKEIVKKEIVKDEDDNEIVKVDLNRLLKENEETVGWINIPGTEIDYPVVKHSDNSYYLTHSFDKSYSGSGWIYMDYRSNPNLEDKNTIIYGHNMINNTMFGTIKNIFKNNYISEYKGKYYIYLSTLNGNYTYEIFSVYHLDPTDDYLVTYFETDEAFSEWLDFIKNRTMEDYGVSVTSEDKILTLSSCYSMTERFAVHAKLISKN